MTLQEKINHVVYQYLRINTDEDILIDKKISLTKFKSTKVHTTFDEDVDDHLKRIELYSKELSKVVLDVIKNHIGS